MRGTHIYQSTCHEVDEEEADILEETVVEVPEAEVETIIIIIMIIIIIIIIIISIRTKVK